MGYYRVVIFGLTPYFCCAISRCGSRSQVRRRCGSGFFLFWNFSVGCEWDRDPELEIEIGLLALPSGDGPAARSTGAGRTSATGRAGGGHYAAIMPRAATSCSMPSDGLAIGPPPTVTPNTR